MFTVVTCDITFSCTDMLLCDLASWSVVPSLSVLVETGASLSGTSVHGNRLWSSLTGESFLSIRVAGWVSIHHHHWAAGVSRGWAKASACHLQVSLSCAVLCQIVSLLYLSRSSCVHCNLSQWSRLGESRDLSNLNSILHHDNILYLYQSGFLGCNYWWHR